MEIKVFIEWKCSCGRIFKTQTYKNIADKKEKTMNCPNCKELIHMTDNQKITLCED